MVSIRQTLQRFRQLNIVVVRASSPGAARPPPHEKPILFTSTANSSRPSRRRRSTSSTRPLPTSWRACRTSARLDVDRAVRAARAAFDDGPWKDATAQDRGRVLFKLAEIVRSRTAELAYLRNAQHRQADSSKRRATSATSRPASSTTAAWRRRFTGDVIPVPDNAMSLAAARADRRRRPDHPVELSAADGFLEARAGESAPAARQC